MAGTGAGAAAHMQKHRVAPSARPRLHQRALLSYPPRPSTAFSFRSLLNRLLRRTCLSLPTFFLPCHLCFTLPTALLSHLRPGASPQDRAHRAFDTRERTALSPGTTANGFALSPALKQADFYSPSWKGREFQ